MSEYIVRVDEDDQCWHYVQKQYEHFFGYPLVDEIVRCRDCKYLCDDGSTWGCGWHCSCLTTNDGTPPDGFCAWGEKRTKLDDARNVQ